MLAAGASLQLPQGGTRRRCGTFSDSDSSAADRRRRPFVGAEYALSDIMLLALIAQQAFIDDADETDYMRVQLDLSVKF